MRIALMSSSPHPELILAIKRAGMQPEEYSLQDPQEKLNHYAGYIITENFSEALLSDLKIQSQSGKPLLGIGRGAKFLIDTGLVPGLENHQPCINLIDNHSTQNVTICLSDSFQLNAFTRYLNPRDILSLSTPSESGFKIPPALLMEIKEIGMNVFHYCDAKGQKSVDHIAALSNKSGNVMAMLPCPQLTSSVDLIFQSMRDYIHEGFVPHVAPLSYYPRKG
ncbi:MAG TPA: hypothetical protein VLI69_05880 [Gammaproteobacteria bacterium]|nr:hypothetical protein [Gammaproteobacteria bacterium]